MNKPLLGITFPARVWARLSFIARLGISTGAALLLAATVMLYSSIKTDTVWHQEKLAEQTKDELKYLIPALSELVVIGDYATMNQILAAQAKHEGVAQLRFVSSKDTVVQADTKTKTLPLSIAPDWFVRFSGLHGEEASTGLIVGGMRYGTLDIKMTPVSAINRVWESFRNHLLILILAIGLDFIGILLILKNGLKPLGALNQGAHKLGAGEFAARIPIQGSPEMRSVIGTFNRMADNIQSLVGEVHREKELALVTLRSIGDAVITTDNHEQVVYLNPVAEYLTGWTTEDAQGLPLAQVFNIVN